MGAWGPGLFSDDLACDVRGGYRALLEDGIADDDAESQILERYASSLADADDGPTVVFALAATESKLGRLSPAIRDRAVALLDAGRGLERWEGRDRGRRRTALNKLRAQLVAPQPTRRAVRPPSRHITKLSPGDLLAFELRSDWYIAMRVMRLHESRVGVAPVVQLLDWRGDHEPMASEVADAADLEPRPLVRGENNRWWSTRSTCLGRRRHDYHDVGFTKVGSIGPRQGDEHASPGSYGGWEGLAARLRAWSADE